MTLQQLFNNPAYFYNWLEEKIIREPNGEFKEEYPRTETCPLAQFVSEKTGKTVSVCTGWVGFPLEDSLVAPKWVNEFIALADKNRPEPVPYVKALEYLEKACFPS
jgi:hypothetical protein